MMQGARPSVVGGMTPRSAAANWGMGAGMQMQAAGSWPHSPHTPMAAGPLTPRPVSPTC